MDRRGFFSRLLVGIGMLSPLPDVTGPRQEEAIVDRVRGRSKGVILRPGIPITEEALRRLIRDETGCD